MPLQCALPALRGLVRLALLAVLVLPALPGTAQVGQGATMTVLGTKVGRPGACQAIDRPPLAL